MRPLTLFQKIVLFATFSLAALRWSAPIEVTWPLGTFTDWRTTTIQIVLILIVGVGIFLFAPRIRWRRPRK